MTSKHFRIYDDVYWGEEGFHIRMQIFEQYIYKLTWLVAPHAYIHTKDEV